MTPLGESRSSRVQVHAWDYKNKTNKYTKHERTKSSMWLVVFVIALIIPNHAQTVTSQDNKQHHLTLCQQRSDRHTHTEMARS